MRRRHHYATTGNRMLLDVSIATENDVALLLTNGGQAAAETSMVRKLIMGDIARITDERVDLSVEVVGSAPIERLDIFRGRDLIETVRPFVAKDLGQRMRVTMEGAEYRGRARTTVWDGSLKVNGNAIRRAEMFNNWNLDRGIRSQSEEAVTWKAVTTGNTCGIDLVAGRSGGRGNLASRRRTFRPVVKITRYRHRGHCLRGWRSRPCAQALPVTRCTA